VVDPSAFSRFPGKGQGPDETLLTHWMNLDPDLRRENGGGSGVERHLGRDHASRQDDATLATPGKSAPPSNMTKK
jgi:hypothetical protein